MIKIYIEGPLCKFYPTPPPGTLLAVGIFILSSHRNQVQNTAALLLGELEVVNTLECIIMGPVSLVNKEHIVLTEKDPLPNIILNKTLRCIL